MKCFLISRCILACVIARQGRRVLILRTRRLRHQERARCCTPVLRKPRQADFLTPAPAGSPARGAIQIANYDCTVRHLEKFSGSMHHWQTLLSRYSTAQNASYNSIERGAVFLRTRSSSRLMA